MALITSLPSGVVVLLKTRRAALHSPPASPRAFCFRRNSLTPLTFPPPFSCHHRVPSAGLLRGSREGRMGICTDETAKNHNPASIREARRKGPAERCRRVLALGEATRQATWSLPRCARGLRA